MRYALKNDTGYVHGAPLCELLKTTTRDKASCAGHRVVGLVPLPMPGVVYNVKEIPFLEGELLWCGGFVWGECTNDLLGRLYRTTRFGESW